MGASTTLNGGVMGIFSFSNKPLFGMLGRYMGF